MKPYLSIIISAWNEDENLDKNAMDKVFGYLKLVNFAYEVIVIDDGSDDNSPQTLDSLTKKWKQLKVFHNSHMGKAAGLVTGVSKASGRFVLFIDMDQATPISEFDKFRPILEQGTEIVIGSRADRKGAPFYRQVLAYGMITLRFLILNLPYKDTQCGFKAFEKNAIDKIFKILSTIHKFKAVIGGAVNPGFDVEILYLARKLGYKTSEVPVAWQYENSKRVRFVKDAISGVSELLLVRWRSITNAYNLH